MSGKLTIPYCDCISTVMSVKTFEIPAVIVPISDCNWYGQFPTHTKTALFYMDDTLRAHTKYAHCVRGRSKKMLSAFGTFQSTNFTRDQSMIEHLISEPFMEIDSCYIMTTKLPISEPIDNISKLSSNTVILIKITIHEVLLQFFEGDFKML